MSQNNKIYMCNRLYLTDGCAVYLGEFASHFIVTVLQCLYGQFIRIFFIVDTLIFLEVASLARGCIEYQPSQPGDILWRHSRPKTLHRRCNNHWDPTHTRSLPWVETAGCRGWNVHLPRCHDTAHTKSTTLYLKRELPSKDNHPPVRWKWLRVSLARTNKGYDYLVNDIKYYCPGTKVTISRVPPRKTNSETMAKIAGLNLHLESRSHPDIDVHCVDVCPKITRYYKQDKINFNSSGVQFYALKLSCELKKFSGLSRKPMPVINTNGNAVRGTCNSLCMKTNIEFIKDQ